ncbi:MAG: ATP-binding protein [archaeon]
MDIKEFEKMLKEKENNDLDFKSELPESKNLAQLVTAFYNSHGGKIILGIADETKELVGLKDSQKVEHKFVQIIRHWCKLDEEPKINFIKYKNKDFIVVDCPKGKDSPYFVRGEHIPRIRVGSSNMPANKEEIARLYREGSSKSFDIEAVPKSDINDLEIESIKKYLEKSNLTKQLKGKYLFEIMDKEGLVSYDKSIKKYIPTYAGILLFGKHPQINISHSMVLADRYQGTDMIKWIDKNEFTGTIFELIKKCENFFMRNMKTEAKVVGFKTEHKTEYPINALREGIINALVHRDYFEKENIMIRMFDDRIEIISPGELLRPLTIEKLLKLDYKPKSRNKRIVDVLLREELMDKRGSGILRMEQAMKKHGLSIPKFKEDSNYFIIKFTGPYQKTVIKIKDKLNKRQTEFIKSGIKNISRKEYSKLVRCSLRTAFNDLNDLLNKKIIKKIGGGKYVRYEFK